MFHGLMPSTYHYKKIPNKTTRLHNIWQVKENMFIELCARNYATYDGLVDGLDGLFKTCMNNIYHIFGLTFWIPK